MNSSASSGMGKRKKNPSKFEVEMMRKPVKKQCLHFPCTPLSPDSKGR